MKYLILMLIQLCIGATLMAADAKDYKTWVKDLGNDSWRIREEATRDLIKAGEDAFTLVVEAKKSNDPEVKQRARYIARRIDLNAEKKVLEALGCVDFDFIKNDTVVAHYLDDHGFVRTIAVYEKTEKIFLHLQKFKRLRKLSIFKSISEESAKQIGKVNSLEVLNLWWQHTDSTIKGDKICEGIQPLTNLRSLTMIDFGVTDDGLKHLKNMKKLDFLGLRHNKITNKGLKHLEGLKLLEYLNLDENPKLTQDAVDALQKKIPGCDLHFWNPKPVVSPEPVSIDSIQGS